MSHVATTRVYTRNLIHMELGTVISII